MPAARQVIQLVDEIAVMPAGVQVDQKLAGGEAEDYGCGGERDPVSATSITDYGGGCGSHRVRPEQAGSS